MTIVQIVYTQPLLFLMYLNWPVYYFLKLISVRKILIHIEENTFSTVRVENPLGFYKKNPTGNIFTVGKKYFLPDFNSNGKFSLRKLRFPTEF